MTPTRSIDADAAAHRPPAPPDDIGQGLRPPSRGRRRTVGPPPGRGLGVRIGSHRVSVSTLLLLDVVLLCIIGLVMVGSASSVISIATYGSPWAILIREAMWMAIGWHCPLAGHPLRLPQAAAVQPAHHAGDVRPALRRAGPGPRCPRHGLEPLGRLRAVPAAALRADEARPHPVRRRLHHPAPRRGRSDRRIIGPLLIVTGFACVLILAQPDMGTAMVLGFIALALLFVSGVRLGPVMKVLARPGRPGPDCRHRLAHRRARLLSFMDPSAHVRARGTRSCSRSSGWVGPPGRSGIGGGQAQWGFLPNAHTDFIFSVIGEQLASSARSSCWSPRRLHVAGHPGRRAVARPLRRLGLPGPGGLDRGRDAHQRRGRGGCAARHRYSVPFISFGGSSLVITMVAAGILINVARRGESGCTLRVAGSGRRGPARREVGERSAPHGDCGRRDRRPHVPSLQIARALVDRGHPAESIELYGSRRGHEATTCPTLEFPYTLLHGRGLRRSLHPSAWWAMRARSSAWSGLPAGPRLVPAPATPRRGRRRRLRQLPRRRGGGVHGVPLVCMTTDAVPGPSTACLAGTPPPTPGLRRDRAAPGPSRARRCGPSSPPSTVRPRAGRPAGWRWVSRPTARP